MTDDDLTDQVGKKLADLAEYDRIKNEPVNDEHPLIPEGIYTMICIRHEARKSWGRYPKVVLTYRIIGGKYAGVILSKYFNVSGMDKTGRVKVTKNQDITKQYYRVIGGVILKRYDQFPISAFDKITVKAEVVTVKKEWNGDEYPEQLFHSRIGKLLEKVR